MKNTRSVTLGRLAASEPNSKDAPPMRVKQIFPDSELPENSVIRNFRITADDGKITKWWHPTILRKCAIGSPRRYYRIGMCQFRVQIRNLNIRIHQLPNNGLDGSQVTSSLAVGVSPAKIIEGKANFPTVLAIRFPKTQERKDSSGMTNIQGGRNNVCSHRMESANNV